MSNDIPAGNARDTLRKQLERAQSVDDLLSLLRAIPQRDDATYRGFGPEVACDALARVASLTVESPESAAAIILECLLPWCLQTEFDPGDSQNSAMLGYRFRKLLKDWIYAYPQDQMPDVRQPILNAVLLQLSIAPTKELVWVLGTIGYGATAVKNALWALSTRPDDLVDRALGVLAGLGVTPEERERLFDIVGGRIRAGHLTRGVLFAVQELAGPDRIELAFDLLELAIARHAAEDNIDFAVAVSAATRAVDRCEESSPVHEQMWSILRNHFRTVQMSGDYAYRCNTRGTIRDYVEQLLANEVYGDPEIAACSTLSRLGKLAKPNQLPGWDEVATSVFADFLAEAACKDTGIKGRFATTRMDLKEEAWETALTIACPRLEDWLDPAVTDETNPYAAHKICQTVACLRLQQLPERLLNAIVSTEMVDDENGHSFRQIGFMEVARSSCTRDALDALLNFGLTRDGHVLLTTVDAITDAARARIRAGDSDVIQKVIRMTATTQEKRHREAAIDVFCRLCMRELVAETYVYHLREFATDEGLDEFSRGSALEAIGFVTPKGVEGWRDWVHKLARSDGSDLGWRACEVLIRRDWVFDDDESWLFHRLGLEIVESEVQLRHTDGANGWSAFLIGLLFRRNPVRFRRAVADVLTQAPSDAVYQMLNSVTFLGAKCPDVVSDALFNRIIVANNDAHADIPLFNVLATVAASKLLVLREESNWCEWRVEARVALCTAIRAVGCEDAGRRPAVVECLSAFMCDAAFQVRRVAYRAAAGLAPEHLGSICKAWSQSADIEFRKRAAEAAAWLPVELYSDNAVSDLGFSWDVEPSVRDIWVSVLSDRRQRNWANRYVERILELCRNDADPVLKAYRYGRALTIVGDDHSAASIEDFLAGQDLQPNVVHWLAKIVEELRKNWKKTTEKWPGPWSHEPGTIEDVNGEIVFGDGTRNPASFSLWCRHRSGPSNRTSWGGVAEPIGYKGRWRTPDGAIQILVPGRLAATAIVTASHWTNNSPPHLNLSGSGPYPEEQDPPAAKPEKNPVDENQSDSSS